MAKFTPFLGDLSGKLKGLVFAFNKAGSYVRGFRMPTDPATSAQLNNRGVFAGAVSSWHGLTDTIKGLWNSYASTDFHPKFPKSGVAYSGYNAFVSLYNVALNAINKAGTTSILLPAVLAPDNLNYIIKNAPPRDAFSSSIQAPAGVGLAVTVGAIDLIVTTSTCGLTLVFDRSVGVGVTPDGPIFEDAIGNIPVGYAVVASLPLAQEEMFIENPDINLVAISKPLDEIEDWVIADRITLSIPFVPEFYSRKNTYSAGDLVQCKVYAVSQNGVTMLIGSAFSTLTV